MQEIGKIGGPAPIQQPSSIEKTEKKSRPESSVSTERSGTLINVAELIKTARESPEVRQQLVEEIKRAIEQNVYNIDPERVAKHILREI
ncbi:MAG TPA: flagellar biosynthesis anti-sigma factor FlgM [Pseudothermotoga sp.]|nr:flagellar biosynthesis anti-sigma factor FlgM [Pseudothermotoga sp.]HOK82719.1 flagellar biosynthesis anti-sigma factor FlgM [Pseudothermotoga sp.]HPP70843.1 flagellar biosynthesis anti-sigma factor FlgM [Pseudothermotoga sp.]